MKTIELKLYKFDELSEKVQGKVIENHAFINVDYEWWESVYEDAENIGLKLESFNLDRNRHATGHFNLSASEVAQNILNEHGEQCETSKTAERFLSEWNPVFVDYMDATGDNYESGELEDEMMDIEDDFLKSLLEDYSIMLQNEYEYLTEGEAIRETIQANEYDFTENGEIY